MSFLSTFTTDNYSYTWQMVIEFCIICFLLLLGNSLRRKIPFLKNLLFPAAIIAGIIGLGLKYLFQVLDLQIDGSAIITNEFSEFVTYHAIGIGFAAMALKTTRQEAKGSKDGRSWKSGLLIVNTYLLQAFIGLAITIVIGYISTSIAKYSGILVAFGFGQGPGQAGNNGGVFEALTENGFIGGKAFGLTIATIGTLWACVVGVFHINKAHAQKKVSRGEEEKGVRRTTVEVEYQDEIPLTEAVDKLSIQIAFVGLAYLISFLLIFGITKLLGPGAISSLIWGFNFLIAMLVGMLIKMVTKLLKKTKVMTREYTNEYMLNRISGVAFDFMIACSIMAIEIEKISSWPMVITLILTTTVAGIATYIYLYSMSKKLYVGYEEEGFASMFGMLTGTAPNGIALLREIDPDFKTPASDNLVTGSACAVPFGMVLILVIVPLIVKSDLMTWICFGMIGVIFVIYQVAINVLNKKLPSNYGKSAEDKKPVE